MCPAIVMPPRSRPLISSMIAREAGGALAVEVGVIELEIDHAARRQRLDRRGRRGRLDLGDRLQLGLGAVVGLVGEDAAAAALAQHGLVGLVGQRVADPVGPDAEGRDLLCNARLHAVADGDDASEDRG